MGDGCRFQPFIFQGVTYFPPSLKPSSFWNQETDGMNIFLVLSLANELKAQMKKRLPLDFSFKINQTKNRKKTSLSNYQ